MSIALIPARGGSKRIPRKNIREFCGKPIMAYSIEEAIESNCFDRVIVSTDDHEIAEVARLYGAEVPFLRPAALSDDFATTQDVVVHAIDSLGLSPQSIVCCIYATAPFVNRRHLAEAKIILEQNRHVDFVFSATSFDFPVQRAFRINSNNLCEMFTPQNALTRSQDLEEAYHDSGQFYFGRAATFSQGKNILNGSASYPLVIPRYLVQDIDSEEDWVRAEFMYQGIKASGELSE